MTNYFRKYRLGITPRGRYGQQAAASIAALLDRGEAERRCKSAKHRGLLSPPWPRPDAEPRGLGKLA
jgi:hypothetical protein